MSIDSKARLEVRLERLRNAQNTISYHRDQIDKAFSFFIKATSLISGGVLTLLTQIEIKRLKYILVNLIYGAIFLICLTGIYSIIRLIAHRKTAIKHRHQERQQLLVIFQNGDPVVPPEPEKLWKYYKGNYVELLMISLIVIVLIAVFYFGNYVLIPSLLQLISKEEEARILQNILLYY